LSGRVLNRVWSKSGRTFYCIEINEALVPVREEVKGACEILGLDPLYVANEGKLVALVSDSIADRIVSRMKQHEYGTNACVIGEVKAEPLTLECGGPAPLFALFT
jgi:hydrogenase maturation factor